MIGYLASEKVYSFMKVDNVDKLEFERIDHTEISEGDEVILTYDAHDYDSDGAGVLGEVIETPRDHPEIFEEHNRPMVDFVLHGKDGNKYTWHVDNAYVTGPNEGKGSDIGKMKGFYPVEARTIIED